MREQIHVRVEPATRLGLRALAAVHHSSVAGVASEILGAAVDNRLAGDELARLVLAQLQLANREPVS